MALPRVALSEAVTYDDAAACSSSAHPDGSDAGGADDIKDSPSSQRFGDGDSQDGQSSGHSSPWLPEDVWRHIHSLMPRDAAARAACVSQAFLSSWRCCPKLVLNSQTVKKENRSLITGIESILEDYSRIGVAILRLDLRYEYNCFPRHMDRWLKVAVKPGIEELTLVTQINYQNYRFPYSVLSAGVRSSIRSLDLHSCVFRPKAKFGAFRRLTSLRLHSVSITGNELESLLSISLALERLDRKDCRGIISLKIPSVLQWLSYLLVGGRHDLEILENKVPSISNLSVGVRNSIRSLDLCSCVFRPMAELGAFRSLTSLRLHSVSITGDELECLLSNSLALERLDLKDCREIVSLKIPSGLRPLSDLLVDECYALKTIENKAPSIFNFTLFGRLVKLLLGEASQTIKLFNLFADTAAGYARAKLPSIMPNLETLGLTSTHEENTPMLPTKFVNLKHLCITIISSTLSPSYVYSSLISFLDASPFLETWRLEVPLADMGHELVGSSPLRELPELRHDRLKSMEISGFHSTKSLVELTCCIVKSAVSLESLTLDTTRDRGAPCCYDGLGMVCSMFMVEQASRAVVAIRRYIEDKVAPTAKLTVLEYCPQCIACAVDDGLGPLV